MTILLITDRTAADADRIQLLKDQMNAPDNAAGFTGLDAADQAFWEGGDPGTWGRWRGAYNAIDFSVVNIAMQELMERLTPAGYPFPCALWFDWTTTSIQRRADIERYVQNLTLIKHNWSSVALPIAEDFEYLTSDHANSIELMLLDVEDVINRMEASYRYAGEFYAGEDF